MADTQPSNERFEEIDWEEVERTSHSLPTRTLAFALSLVIYAGVVVYDAFFTGEGEPTIRAIGWNANGIDWLFILTLLVLTFYVVVPLAVNRRMTRYYWDRFKRNKMAIVSLGFLLVIFGVGIVGPLFIDPPKVHVIEAYQPPVGLTVSENIPVSCLGDVSNEMCTGTWEHPLGTTGEGKDILKMVIFGMRVSMMVGLTAMLIQVVIATAVGTTAAYFGGSIDELLMRYVDIQISFPTFVLFLLLVYLFGGSLFLLVVIFGITGWGGIARLVRSEALQRNEEEYIMAAAGVGASQYHIIRQHLVPNVSNTIITAATLAIPFLILSEAALSFLGLTDPTVPSWGQTIAAGRGNLGDAWWISTIPGLFLFFTIMAFNFLGDALRDALDPRQDL